MTGSNKVLAASACALTAACASYPAETPVPDAAAPVEYAMREWTGHVDGRTYGGVVNAPGELRGTLGSYRGCLADTDTGTLVGLSGAMEFHQPDAHSDRQHVYSESLLGDAPAVTVPVGARFSVSGMRTTQPVETIRLEQAVPDRCSDLPVFLTSTGTLAPR